MIGFTAEVDGVEVLNRAFNRIDQQVSDFRSLWPEVARTFYAIERAQFASEGGRGASGKWKPLSPAYARWKAIHYPGEPILRLEHPLVESLTSFDGADSVFRPESDQLTIGTKTPYAQAHQRGGGHLPARPPIDFTEQDKRDIQKSIQRGLIQFVRSIGFEVEERAA